MIKLVNLISINEDTKLESHIEKVMKGIGVKVSKLDAYKQSGQQWVIDLVINNMGKYRDPFDILNDYNDERSMDEPELFDVDNIAGNRYRFYVKNFNKI
jgi:Fe2+ transport system protein B